MSIKIVSADNHQIIRLGLALILAGGPDIQVLGEAADCATTIRLIQELSPQVVIMGICLPDSNGVEATRRILAQFPQIKIIALSMHSDSPLS